MSKVICSALFGDSRVPPSEIRGPLNTKKGLEKSSGESFFFNPRRSNCGGISRLLIASGETSLPVARTSITEN